MQYLFAIETRTVCEVSVYARGPFVHVQCELFLISLTAPDECCPQIKKFKMKQTMETNPGYKVAVWGTKHNKNKILSMLILDLEVQYLYCNSSVAVLCPSRDEEVE